MLRSLTREMYGLWFVVYFIIKTNFVDLCYSFYFVDPDLDVHPKMSIYFIFIFFN